MKPSLTIIAGPCVIETEAMTFMIASVLDSICKDLDFNFIFKASYDKANRTSHESFRGPGLAEGLRILAKVKSELGVKVLTDVHTAEQCAEVAQIVDWLQIPAFLCRQTDLLQAAAKTGKPINVKKGQFLAPEDMGMVVRKIKQANPEAQLMLTERGTCFGYHNLVVDFRSLPAMQKFGFPVIFDATHSTQQPGDLGSSSGGDRNMAPILARAAIATGHCDGLFFETHPSPHEALSDAAVQLPLHSIRGLLSQIKRIDREL
jgi:2-dehydro-3-deoxyphosphooctonate aldolase (KDO 8-P synthase)